MKVRELPGLGVSLVLHAAVAVALALLHFQIQAQDLSLAVESLFETERTPDEFTRELSADTQVSETLSIVASGGVAAALGGGRQRRFRGARCFAGEDRRCPDAAGSDGRGQCWRCRTSRSRSVGK